MKRWTLLLVVVLLLLCCVSCEKDIDKENNETDGIEDLYDSLPNEEIVLPEDIFE